MFKDFTDFNSRSDLCFKDVPYDLIFAAFRQFSAMNAALRTEAYDYATWYNKVMRDKYEDGAPVDVTDVPYLTVPRSQLAMMRSRIRKTREACEYAANAITNIALGAKMESQIRASTSTDDATVNVPAAERVSITQQILSMCFSDPLFVLGFEEGGPGVVINGVNINVTPIIRGGIGIIKFTDANNNHWSGTHQFTRFGGTGWTSAFSYSGSRFFKEPMIVAKSGNSLAYDSPDKVGLMLASLTFFNKKILIWCESTTPDTNKQKTTGAHKFTIFHSEIHASIIDPGQEKATIAASLYGAGSADYNAAMAYNATPKCFLIVQITDQSSSPFVTMDDDHVTPGWITMEINTSDVVSPPTISPDFISGWTTREATTQTAIKDLFLTDAQWDSLLSALTEA